MSAQLIRSSASGASARRPIHTILAPSTTSAASVMMPSGSPSPLARVVGDEFADVGVEHGHRVASSGASIRSAMADASSAPTSAR